MAIIEQGTIGSTRDLLKLGIVDWNRLNGHWPNMADALDTIASWLVGTTSYTRLAYDLTAAPQRADWPGWEHAGSHELLGRRYWDTFRARYPDSALTFSDEPDFYGVLRWLDDAPQSFWGDIGKVSASCFALTIKQLDAHDLWISVLDEHTQVVLEPLVSLRDLWAESEANGSATR